MNTNFVKTINVGKKKILVLQGGGIRGVITTNLLKQLQHRARKPLWQVFDLIVGTSTGAIIRSMLAFGVPANKIHDIYAKQGRLLFTSYPWYKRLFSKNMPKYDRSRMIDKMISVYRQWFGVIPLMGQAKTNLMLTTFGAMSGRTHFIMSWDQRHRDMRMVSRSSPFGPIRWSALSAVYYFGQIIIPSYKWLQDFQVQLPRWQYGRVFQDGGQGNDNCPIQQAIITALKLNWIKQPVRMLDLGCGQTVLRQPMNDVRNDFLPGQIANFVMQARGQSTYDQVHSRQSLASSLPDFKFCRISPILSKAQDKLDAIDKINDFIRIGDSLKIKIPDYILG